MKKKTNPVESFENDVLLSADHFRVVRFIGRGQFERAEFSTNDYMKAFAFARELILGKPRMLYVVNGAGRSVLLEPQKDELWLRVCQRYA